MRTSPGIVPGIFLSAIPSLFTGRNADPLPYPVRTRYRRVTVARNGFLRMIRFRSVRIPGTARRLLLAACNSAPPPDPRHKKGNRVLRVTAKCGSVRPETLRLKALRPETTQGNTMETQTIAQTYRSMSDADKEAYRELRAEMETKTGKPVPMADALAALTPGYETPDYLKNT